MNLRVVVLGLSVFGLCTTLLAQSVATITQIEGEASLLRSSVGTWKSARVGAVLILGDELATRGESFAEIRYTNGAVLRMDENTKIVLAQASDKAYSTQSSLGKVWVNMQKITKKGTEFSVVSPTATAAIRGTVFELGTTADSSTSVAVFDGKVDVGPTTSGKNTNASSLKTEVSGPTEIPGPYEVSLSAWKQITKGQQITVRRDGKFAQTAYNQVEKNAESFVSKNKKLDKDLLLKQ